MNNALRFYTDQHFPVAVSQGLRRHGVDILTTQEAGRCGSSDEEQLAFATEQGRVLVTFDTDFLALHQAHVSHEGIAWCPEQKHSVGQLIQGLLLAHGVLAREAMHNHVEYI